MSETFACPQCGKSYPHAGRKPGKAVVCVCGRRFLVPAPEVRTARDELPLQPAPAEPRPAPARSKSNFAGESPATRPVRPVSPPRSSPSQPKEMVAEVVYPGDSAEVLPVAEWVSPAPYAPAPLSALPVGYDSFAPPAVARSTRRTSTESSELFGLWVGRVVLFVVVPLAMLCVLIADLQMHRNGGIAHHARRGRPASVFRAPLQ